MACLPPDVGKLQNLKELVLCTAKLSSLPEEIGDMANLTHLALRCSAVASLPPSLGNLQNLISLDLSHTSISCLPPFIGKLHNLKKLTLTSTKKLSSLSQEIGDLANLIELNLRSSGITSLPPSIGNLQSLTILNLSYAKKLSSLPKEIGNLTNLKVLQLVASGVPLVSLPNSMGYPTSLMRLEVYRHSWQVDNLQENEHKVLRMLLQHCQILGNLWDRNCRSRKREEYLFAMACNRARFRTGFGTIANQTLTNKDSIQTTRKLWPIMLKNATGAFRGYSRCDEGRSSRDVEHRCPWEMPKQDAVYQLLAMGRESFIGALLDRKTKKI